MKTIFYISLCSLFLVLVLSQSAAAQLISVSEPGTEATKSCLGPYPMTPVGYTIPPGATEFTYTESPISGTIGFNAPYLLFYFDPAGFTNGFKGPVYLYNSLASPSTVITHVLTMPPNTRAFYFHTTHFLGGDATVVATSTGGTASVGPIAIPQAGNGPDGTTVSPYFGFYTADPSTTITQISITGTLLLGLVNFGIYQGEFISPTQQALMGPISANFTSVCPNQPVNLKAEGIGNSFVVTGPNGYVFSSVYSSIGNHPALATGITQPGLYTLTATLGCTQASRTITLSACP